MATQDDFIKTALRLPRVLHTAIRDEAERSGKSMNAEIIGRLQDSLRLAETSSMLTQLKSREAELLEANKHQLELMRGIIARAAVTLQQVSDVLGSAPSDERQSRLLHEIAVFLDLVNALQIRRSD